MDGFRKFAEMDVSSLIPAPKSPRGSFSLHPHPHRGKTSVPGAPNRAIPMGIPTDGYILTSLNTLDFCL
jgi:hypothetical protein